MTELFARDEFEEGAEARLSLATELTTGTQLARIEENVQLNIETGNRAISPGYVSNIVEVEINSDRASVVDCSQGLGELFSADRELLVPADDFFKLRETRLVLIDGQWFVDDFNTGGDNRCDPDA